MSANAQLEPAALISDNLLSEFEPNLLCQAISIFELQLLNVNAYSLARRSSFFLKRFAAKGSAREPLVLTRDAVGSVDGLKIILYFCHFDCLRDMEISLLRDSLTAALHFECTDLEQYASEFATSQLSLETANSIWQQVRVLPELPVTATVRTFVLRHFLTLAQRDDFLDFSADAIVDLLRDDRLNAWQEDLLVEPLLRWLRGRVTPLWDQMCLLSSLRFDMLSRRARAALGKLDGFQYFKGFRRSPMFCGMCQPAELRRSHEGVLVLGGRINDVPTDKVYYLDPRSGRWAKLAPRFGLPEPRIDFGCEALGDGRVIVAGGQKGSDRLRHTAECLCLDLRNDEAAWQPAATLHEARCRLSTVVCNSVLYAIGGENSTGCLATVEALEVMRESGSCGWRLRAPLPEGRSGPGLASVAGRVIACGGYCGIFGQQPREFVDSYDPELNQWTRLAPMQHPRGCACLLVLPSGEHPQLLVLGGNSDAGPERLQFCAAAAAASGGRPPRWVTASPAPPLQIETSAACLVDSRWLVVEKGDSSDEVLSSSIAVPAELLLQSRDGQQQLPAAASFPNWFRGLNTGDFAVAAVAGLQVIDRLLEEAAWLSH